MRLVEAALEHPVGIHRDELADKVRLAGRAGTCGTYLSRARTAGLLAVEDGIVRPTEALFP